MVRVVLYSGPSSHGPTCLWSELSFIFGAKFVNKEPHCLEAPSTVGDLDVTNVQTENDIAYYQYSPFWSFSF